MKSILIIDDATFQADILKTVLDNAFSPAVIEVVKSVSNCTDYLTNNEYDLVLVDFLLGENYTAVDLKQENEHLQSTSTTWTVLSALDPQELYQQNKSAGFTDFIHKTDYPTLISKVKEYLYPVLD